ncbi:hypothetical protein [Nocardioides conyzicola]
MTTPSSEAPAPVELRLGRDVARRMRLPGPPVGRPLPSRIGSLASSVSRFAAATSRPVDVRRALIGPDPRGLSASSAPPRWWTPVERQPESPASAPDSGDAAVRRTTDAPGGTPAWLSSARPVAIRRLPERSLPRAAREVPNEATWTPGGIVGGLRGEVARIRRMDEVAAVGPMLTQNDRAKLNAGMAARQAQQAAAQQATSQPAVARRATTRTPRQPASAASAPPSASEPPTGPAAPSAVVAPAAAPAPAGGAPSTVSRSASVDPTPAAPAIPASPASGAPSTVSPSASVEPAPPGQPAPAGGAPSTVHRSTSVDPTPPAPPAPTGGAPSTVSRSTSVDPAPPTSAGHATSPGSGAPATVAGSGSVAPAAGDTAAAVGAPVRRVARPSWQLRSQQSRFAGLVRRTPIGHSGHPASVPSAATAPPSAPIVGLASIVSRLATPDRARPVGATAGSTAGPGSGPTTGLETAVRGSTTVTAAGPALIAGGADAPATIRRHAWSAGSLVMRQAAGAREQAGLASIARATSPTATGTVSRSTGPGTTAAPGTTTRSASTSPGQASAAPGTMQTSTTPSATTPRAAPAATSPDAATPAGTAPSAPAARAAEPVVRRLPSAVGPTPVTSTDSGQHDPAAATAATAAGSPVSSSASSPAGPAAGSSSADPGTAAAAPSTPRGLPRLWRRATEVRPATDVRTSVPAPVVRLAAEPGASTPAAPASAATVRRLPAASAPAPGAAPGAPAATTPSPGTPAARTPAAGIATASPSSPTSPAAPTTAPAAAASPAASTAASTAARPVAAPGAPTGTPATTAAAAAAAAATPAAAVRRSTFPASRVGAHVASPWMAGVAVGMPELMTIRRATAHGTDANRTLATGFGASQTIRPAGSPVAAPVAAVGGESRLWRRTITPAGVVRSFGAPAGASAAPMSLTTPAAAAAGAGAPATTRTAAGVGTTAATARASAPPVGFAAGFATGRAAAGGGAPDAPRFSGAARAASPSAPVRRTWQPWSDSPAPAGTAPGAAPTTSFPAGPPGAASAPSGRRAAPDLRRMTVAPPRISVAPSQPPPPPVPEVARTGNLPVRAPSSSPVRRSNTAPGSSLVDATAHLFATPDAPLVRRYTDPGGSSMPVPSQSGASGDLQIRRTITQSDHSPATSGNPDFLSDGVTDSLVDKVVERIERRVIEELERRGHRQGRGQY